MPMVGYSFYTDVYMGWELSEKEFEHRIRQATGVLEKFSRIFRIDSPGPDSRDMALCAMAEGISRYYKRAGYTATSVGGVSVTYDTGKGLGSILLEQAKIYLDFHRGVS